MLCVCVFKSGDLVPSPELDSLRKNCMRGDSELDFPAGKKPWFQHVSASIVETTYSWLYFESRFVGSIELPKGSKWEPNPKGCFRRTQLPSNLVDQGTLRVAKTMPNCHYSPDIHRSARLLPFCAKSSKECLPRVKSHRDPLVDIKIWWGFHVHQPLLRHFRLLKSIWSSKTPPVLTFGIAGLQAGDPFWSSAILIQGFAFLIRRGSTGLRLR